MVKIAAPTRVMVVDDFDYLLIIKMKRKILSILLIASALGINAQNVQLHYDLGHVLEKDLGGRPSVTTTVEIFKPDAWGNTFLFVDLDYFHDGVAGAYWEVSREFNISHNKRWAAHLEYDGGLSSKQDTYISTRFQHTALVGPAWNWASADFSKTLSLQALYKYCFKGQNPWNKPFNSFQATAVWGLHFANRLFSFTGFIDCWYDANVKGNWITITEPQFWVNLNALKGCKDFNLSLGTEVEISNNFVFDDNGRNDKFHAIPTIAMKWTF